jgi:hypothetical protein
VGIADNFSQNIDFPLGMRAQNGVEELGRQIEEWEKDWRHFQPDGYGIHISTSYLLICLGSTCSPRFIRVGRFLRLLRVAHKPEH